METSAGAYRSDSDETRRPACGPLTLVLDPDEDYLDLMRLLLGNAGYRVVTARTVGEARRQIGAERPVLVIAELLLATLPRLGFTAVLTARDGLSAIPLLICTADARLARRLGAELRRRTVGVIIKPFDIDELLRTIALHVGSPQQQTTEG